MISIAGRGFKQSEIRSKVKKLKRLRYIVRRRAHAGIPRSILFGLKTTNQGKIFTFQATKFRKNTHHKWTMSDMAKYKAVSFKKDKLQSYISPCIMTYVVQLTIHWLLPDLITTNYLQSEQILKSEIPKYTTIL